MRRNYSLWNWKSGTLFSIASRLTAYVLMKQAAEPFPSVRSIAYGVLVAVIPLSFSIATVTTVPTLFELLTAQLHYAANSLLVFEQHDRTKSYLRGWLSEDNAAGLVTLTKSSHSTPWTALLATCR